MFERYLAPGDLRKLLSALSLVLGFMALAGTFAFIVVPGLRLQPFTDRPVQAVELETGWLDPTDYPGSRSHVLPPVDPATLLTPNPALLARGAALYRQDCAACHGPEGRGDGPGARGLRPPPRNFAEPAGWKHGPHLEALYRTLTEGLPGTAMGSFAYLTRADRMALAHAVQALEGRPEPSDAKAMAELARLFASGPERIPARIPVAQACALLCKEARPPAPLPPWPGEPIAIQDPARAAQALAGLGPHPDQQRIAAQVPYNGFAPQVATWSRERWDLLCASLQRTEEVP